MNINTLKKDIDELKYMVEHSSSKSQKRYYTNILINLLYLISDIEDTIVDYEPVGQNISFINKTAVQYQDLNIKQVSEDNYRIFINQLCCNSLKQLKSYQDMMYLTQTFSINQAKELVLDFFNDYDKNLYNIVKKTLDDEHLFIINNKYKNNDGFSLFNTHSSNPYIVLYTNGSLTLEHLHCLVHEIGHIINFYYIQKNPGYYTKLVYSNMVEIPSTTFEFLFKHYLIQHKLYLQDVDKDTNNNLLNFKAYLTHLKLINKIIHELPLESEIDISYIEFLLKQNGIDINKFCDYSCFNNILLNYGYVYGYTVAIYYLQKYINDKEKTRFDIYNFNKNIISYDDFYMLNNFGLNFEHIKESQHIKTFVESSKKH